jgi:hypothetical protein
MAEPKQKTKKLSLDGIALICCEHYIKIQSLVKIITY